MLEIKDLCVHFQGFSLKDVSFTVNRADFFILLGESGAGKSILLEAIAGLVVPDSGAICLDGTDITSARIQDRHVGLVFQDHAIFPHMTVFDNIAYSLHHAPQTKEQKRRMVQELAAELGIGHLLPRRPGTLSGGELQRVALGRTLIQKPEILLLDEPLSSLDSRLKGDLRRLLRTIHRNGQTILHVTHDYEEAISLGNSIAVIHEGEIIQQGTPEDVFHHPKSGFVARFTGMKNFFPGRFSGGANAGFAISGTGLIVRTNTEINNGDGFILIRGEDILISKEAVETSAANNFEGVIDEIVPHINGVELTIHAGAEFHALITKESLNKLDLNPGQSCWIHFKATAVRFIPR